MKIENIKRVNDINMQLKKIKLFLENPNETFHSLLEFLSCLDKEKKIRFRNLLKEFQEEYLKELESL